MNYLFTILLLSIPLHVVFVGSLEKSEVLIDDRFPQYRQYADSLVDTATVEGIAVFLLASLTNSRRLGTVEDAVDHRIDYFERLVAAKRTWAAHIVNFYGVTGNGIKEKEIFSETSRICANLTDSHQFKDVLVRGELYECSGSNSTKVRILHLRTCEGTKFGAKGPCCRCNGAMNFFLDSFRRSKFEHSRHPRWFIFADDDYFLRIHYIEAILEAYDPRKSFAIKLWGNGDRSVGSPDFENGVNQGRPGFGLSIYNNNCTHPCVHGVEWMGFGGFRFYLLIKSFCVIEVTDYLQHRGIETH